MSHQRKHLILWLIVTAWVGNQNRVFAQNAPPASAKRAAQVIELSLSDAGGAVDIVLGDDEALYGVNPSGGRFKAGFIFRLSLEAFSRPQPGRNREAPNVPQANDITILHTFGDPRLGVKAPSYSKSIIAGGDNVFYVTNGSDAIRYTSKGDLVEKIEFAPKFEYGHPHSGQFDQGNCFAAKSDGTLWCLNSNGVVFRSRGDGKDFAVLERTKFWKTATLGDDGYIYGTTLDEVVKVKEDGTELTTLHKFTGAEAGTDEPMGPVALVNGGGIYGYAHKSLTGAYPSDYGKYRGVLYKIDRQGSNFAIVANFNEARGRKGDGKWNEPNGVLAVGGNWVYGVIDRGFFRVSDEQPKIALLLPSKERQEPKTIVIHQNAAYVLNNRSSIFRILLPALAPGSPAAEKAVLTTPPPVSSGTSVAEAQPPVDSSPNNPSTAPLASSGGSSVFRKRGAGTTQPEVRDRRGNVDVPKSRSEENGAEWGESSFGAPPQGSTNSRSSQARETDPGEDDSNTAVIATAFVQAFSGPDVSALADLYAEQVDYANSGLISNAAVQAQAQEYFTRWPVRKWTLAGPVKVTSLGSSVQQVVFSARYDASNPDTSRHTSGIATETLVLAADSTGAMKIISQREKIVGRGNSTADSGTKRRPRGEKVYQGKRVDPPTLRIPIPGLPWR